MSYLNRSKIARAKKRAKKLGAPAKGLRKYFAKDKLILDVAFALTVSFAAQVRDNENIEEDELILDIAKHTISIFEENTIVFADNEGMKYLLRRKIEPILMSTKSSAAIMLVVLIEYLVNEVEYPLAIQSFTKILPKVVVMRSAMEEEYFDEYKKQQALLMVLLDEEPAVPFAIRKVMNKYKTFITRGTLTQDVFDRIGERVKEMYKLCVWGDVKIKDPEMIFGIFLVLEKFKDDLDKQISFIRNVMNPLTTGIKDKNVAVNILTAIANKDLKGDLSAQIILSLDAGKIDTGEFLYWVMRKYWIKDVQIDDIVGVTYINSNALELEKYLSTFPDYYVEINDYNKNNILEDISNITLEDFKKLLRKHNTIKKARRQ